MTNTLMQYLYRDANNFKALNRIVLKGEISQEQKESIMDCLENSTGDCGDFIPNQVGLPEIRLGDVDQEDDGPWFELDLEYAFTETDEKADTSITIDELVTRFKECKGAWNTDSWEQNFHSDDFDNEDVCDDEDENFSENEWW